LAEIIPFQGLRYNIDKVGGLSLVTAPPYDVISEGERALLYEKSPYNIIHLTLGKDIPGKDKYKKAASLIADWVKDEALLLDKRDCIYVYEQEYTLSNGLQKKRRGFIALLKLERFGGAILPHEETLSAPREDRLKLLRACPGSLSPIFMLYDDPERAIDSTLIVDKLIIEFESRKGEAHRVWRITSSEKIERLKEAMRGKNVYLADGHHRYEAALAYQGETGACNYIMAYLTNMTDDGLTILPVHRLIQFPHPDTDKIEKEAGKFFAVENVTSLNRMLSRLRQGRENHAIGFYSKGKGFKIFSLKDENILSKVFGGNRSIEWKMLDTNILHKILLNQILGKEEIEKDSIAYITSAEEAVAAVENGRFNVAFFLNPIKASQVKSIAQAGEKMPGKATYFYPKLLDGLIIWQAQRS
jgi:uncharacterized protein (DUF1015 family)